MSTLVTNSKSSPESPTFVKSSYQAHHYTSSVESARTALSANSNDILVGEQWLVLGRIGEGSFGEVFEARDIDTNRSYAIKREPKSMRHPQLKHESIMYDALVGGPGIPACHWYGEHDDFNCIVIDLLGPSLKLLRQAVSDISLDIVLNIACQLITTLEHIHSRGIIYRDIKPDNFLFPVSFRMPDPDCFETQTGNGFMVYETARPSCKALFEDQSPSSLKLSAIDFGLASWWRNPSTNKPYPEGKRRIRNKTGTARYASLNVHRGREHSRRDDMESIGYLLIDLALGSLPWTGIQARNSRLGWDKMREAKQNIMLQDLCAGLPLAFLKYIEYTRALKFEDEPDYTYLRSLFEGAKDGGPYSGIVESFEQSYMGPKAVEVLSTISDQGTITDTQGGIKRQQAAWSDVDQYKQHTTGSRDNDGIFAMDDIAPNDEENTGFIDGQKRERQDSAQRNIRQRNREPSSGSPSSYKKLLQQTKESRSHVGWNTHRRLQQAWEPKIDWETIPPAEKTSTSWGEDRPDGMWSKTSDKIKSSWGEADAGTDSWTSNNRGWNQPLWDGEQVPANGVQTGNGAGKHRGDKKMNGQSSLRDTAHAEPWAPPSTANYTSTAEVYSVTTQMSYCNFVDKGDDQPPYKAQQQSSRRGRSKGNSKTHRQAEDERKTEHKRGGNERSFYQQQRRNYGMANHAGVAPNDNRRGKSGENWSPDVEEDWQREGKAAKSERKPFRPKAYKQAASVAYNNNIRQKGSL